jgi:predicted DNA-binding transcriptional regulator AlpA
MLQANERSNPAVTGSTPGLKTTRLVRQIAPEIADDRLIDVYQWAAACGVSVRQIYRWITLAQIPSAEFALGRVRRWRLSTLKAWLEANSGSGESAREIK